MTDNSLPDAQPERWMADAACQGMDTDFFFPERGAPTAGIRRICAGCPVADDCLDYALRLGEKHGFWGGKSERERRTMRAQRRASGWKPPAQPINHGTNGGYQTHIRRNDPPCDDCRQAMLAYERNRRAKRKANAA